jgi:hypothetical protein
MNNDIGMDYCFLIKQETWTFGDPGTRLYVAKQHPPLALSPIQVSFCLSLSHNPIKLAVSLLFA